MTLNAWFVALSFAALLLAASLHLLSAVDHFPKEERKPEFAGGKGGVLLHGSILLVLIAVMAGIWLVFTSTPWYAAVIAGGLGALVAPLILPNFSDRFVDGKGALVVFTLCAYLSLAAIRLFQ